METDFKLFDPQIHTENSLPNEPGNYIVALRPGCQLPPIGITPTYKQWKYEGKQYDIVYTGISNRSLRKRDYAQHFTGNNAGRSTLRKSLGSIMGFNKIPRDKNKPENGKTKFNPQDEETLSAWMKENLLLFYKPAALPKEIENNEADYIRRYNPPLNLADNHNEENRSFREKLSELRKQK